MTTRGAAFAVQELFSSARLASTLSSTAIGLAIMAWAVHNIIGWAGLIAALSVLVLLCCGSVWARRTAIDASGLLPLSLLAFGGWAVLSVLWSHYQWATIGGLAYLAAFTALGLYIAMVRNSIQVTRAFGDALRVVLVLSLAFEVLSGLLIDSPITFLGIAGNLDTAGPISGLLGNRNELGLLAVIGGISFAIEWRTRSISRGLAVLSLVLAAVTLALTRSPIAWGTAAVAIAVLAVLYGIRRLAPALRRPVNIAVLFAAVIAAGLAWATRTTIISALNAGGELDYRLTVWQQIWVLVQPHLLEGWGWIGQWNTGVPPYVSIATGPTRVASSALNAYLDVWFQLGMVGLFLFVGLLGLAFTRSWLLATRKRSVVFTWPAVVLAALITASLAESAVLTEFGLLTVVICCVNASQNLSWRTALRPPHELDSVN